MKDFTMIKTLFLATAAALLFNGCSEFSFQSSDTPPVTEHDKAVYHQQKALQAQQETMLDTYKN